MNTHSHSRRQWLRTVAGALLAGAARAQDRSLEHAVIGSKDPRMIVHSSRPADLETPPELFDSWITPIDRFYVRTHFYLPSVDTASWRCKVDGLVDQPLTLALKDLEAFESVERVVTLECAGNGRARFQPRVPGTQWSDGAIGTARWKGVRLRDVLRKAGVRDAAKHIAFDGADSKIGNAPEFIRSFPIEKCMHPDTLLATHMNGEAIPLPHGAPLRLITPGWEGAACVKWVEKITARDTEFDGAFMTKAYRMPTHRVEPGASVPASETAPITRLFVKSLITHPRTALPPSSESFEIRGFAWAGPDDVQGVRVSADSGRTWKNAELGSDKARYAWREFRCRWDIADASAPLVLMSQATDNKGMTQPLDSPWNPSGYLRNTVDRVELPAPASLPEGAGKEILERSCTACHNLNPVMSQRLGKARWEGEVQKMSDWGASLTPEDKQTLVEYLSQHFPENW